MESGIEGNPNCPACLHPLTDAGSDARPYWACPTCSHTALTA